MKGPAMSGSGWKREGPAALSGWKDTRRAIYSRFVEEESAMNTVTIDWPCGAEPPSWFCPACGKQTIDSENGLVEPPCLHLEFLYLTEIDEFEYIKENLKDLIEKERQAGDAEEGGKEEDWDEMSDYELLKNAMNRDSTFVTFELTTSGMACGPVSSTVCIGYRLFEKDF